jgi:glucan phosphorylase
MTCCSCRLVEIAEEVEEDQCFLFGHLTPDVDHVRYLNQYEAMPLNERCAELAKVSALRNDIAPDVTDTLASDRSSMPSKAACSEMEAGTPILLCCTPLSMSTM